MVCSNKGATVLSKVEEVAAIGKILRMPPNQPNRLKSCCYFRYQHTISERKWLHLMQGTERIFKYPNVFVFLHS